MKSPRIDPLLVLEARAQARAILFAAVEYEDSGEAVAPLLAYAHESGLAGTYGADTIISIIREAFKGVCDL